MIESNSKEEFEAALARQAKETASSQPMDLSKSKGKWNQLHVVMAIMVLFIGAVLVSGFFKGESNQTKNEPVKIQVGQRQ